MSWLLFAAALLGVALYVRARDLRISMGLAVHFEPAAGPTVMTVAVVDEFDTRWGVAAVVSRLAELATSDELVAARLCSRLRADRLLKISYTLAGGAGLQEVWRRSQPAPLADPPAQLDA